jgi:hypothetical protein
MALWAERDRHETAAAISRSEGIAIGRDLGIAIGKDLGIAIGKDQGIAIGKDQGIAIGKDQGVVIGKLAQARETARRAFKIGLDTATIAGFTGLTVAEIEALRKEADGMETS